MYNFTLYTTILLVNKFIFICKVIILIRFLRCSVLLDALVTRYNPWVSSTPTVIKVVSLRTLFVQYICHKKYSVWALALKAIRL